jgi:hypothetical protein
LKIIKGIKMETEEKVYTEELRVRWGTASDGIDVRVVRIGTELWFAVLDVAACFPHYNCVDGEWGADARWEDKDLLAHITKIKFRIDDCGVSLLSFVSMAGLWLFGTKYVGTQNITLFLQAYHLAILSRRDATCEKPYEPREKGKMSEEIDISDSLTGSDLENVAGLSIEYSKKELLALIVHKLDSLIDAVKKLSNV